MYPLFWSLVFCLLVGCSRYHVDVHQQKINASYLASSYVGSPDPRQEHPPLGEMLVIDWLLPQDLLEEHPSVMLHVIYWNNTEKSYNWPIKRRKGYLTLAVLDEEYEQTGGFLTYRAEIITQNGQVFRDWKHQLWVNLIKVEEDNTSDPENTL